MAKEFYDSEPHVPASKIAGNKLTEQTSSLGNETLKMVPQNPGRTTGLAGAAHAFAKPPIAHAHGFGHTAVQRVKGMRLSGHPSAHRIGGVVPKVPKIPKI